MKKYYPYIFPVIALLFVVFLAFRWYRTSTQSNGEISPFGEGVEIENLSQEEAQRVLKGVGDFKSVELTGDNDFLGQVRYEIQDEKIRFSVSADLPILEKGEYQVWLKEVNGEAKRKVFVLDYGKAGFIGSAAISAKILPFEIIVSQEMLNDEKLEEILLRGVIQAQ